MLRSATTPPSNIPPVDHRPNRHVSICHYRRGFHQFKHPTHTSYALAKAFDQDKGTGGTNQWWPFQSALPNVDLVWQFTNPFRVTSYKIKGGSDTFADRGPKAFVLYGSNNGTSGRRWMT